jgi:hypothetical protein
MGTVHAHIPYALFAQVAEHRFFEATMSYGQKAMGSVMLSLLSEPTDKIYSHC